MKLSITDKIRMIFVMRNETFYYHKEKGQVGAALPGGELRFDAGPNQVECRFIYDKKIPREKREEVLSYLNHKNVPEWGGKFEMDEEGTVSYRMYTDVSEANDVEFGSIAVMKIMTTKMGRETAESVCRIADGAVTAKELCPEDN